MSHAPRDAHYAAVQGVIGSVEELTGLMGGVVERLEQLHGEIAVATSEQTESGMNAMGFAYRALDEARDTLSALRVCMGELERYGNGF